MDPRVRTYGYPALVTLIALWFLTIAMPTSWKDWAPSFLNPTLHLGLDLQGGTQLDFRISETEMEKQIAALKAEIAVLEASNGSETEIADKRAQISSIEFQRQNVTEAIRTVLERRVNSLGVSEAVITPSYYGSEKHLLVECPGIVDVQQCINTVGKTILLEFKEQVEGEDEEHIAKMRALADSAEKRMTESGDTLATVGQDLGTTLGAFFSEDAKFYRDELPKGLEDVWDRPENSPVLVREIALSSVTADGQPIENRGVIMLEVVGAKAETDRTLTDPMEAMAELDAVSPDLTLKKHEKTNPSTLDPLYRSALGETIAIGTLIKAENNQKQRAIVLITEYEEPVESIQASHILIAYEGAVRAEPTVIRTKDRAEQLAREIMKRIQDGEKFDSIARTESDGTSADEGGKLGNLTRGAMPPAFEESAWKLPVGNIAGPVETEFGYHIIRKDSAAAESPGSLSYEELLVSGENAEAVQADAFTKLQNRAVARKEEQMTLRTLFFSFLPTGWKDTALDGKHFRRATVTTDPLTGIPVVQIAFDEEGGRLFHELTKKNIGKPIAIFVGGELISAPTVQSEISGGTAVITGSQNFDEANSLAQDLNTGAIPAPVHLVGQVSVEATLGAKALTQSMWAALVGLVAVGLYMIWYYRILGVIAVIVLFCYAVILVAILKLPVFLFTDQYVVLTLAGIAGTILSVGMAVDANVLVFERMKEELKKGKMLQTAADIGFKRAWSSIRDSNFSTLITAAILFLIGSSIVRGFAVTLAIGIFISMFTALVITRYLISLLYKSPIAENLEAFGIRKE